jgi:aspartyl-tRNA(Asn)/glutamyl-tRNA(Gln) amidotransferase subunit A
VSKNLHTIDLRGLIRLLEEGTITSQTLTQYYLERIHLHNKFGAFLAQDRTISLEQAKRADMKRLDGKRSVLLGIPVAHKDIFVTVDFPTTAGSKMLAQYQSPFDATVVRNLGLQGGGAGMVNLGKLNCDEFAMGSGNENSAYHPVLNPWNITRVPGGSSGGSATAVAAGLTPVATATDTGGSIRQPASFCGVTGIKPTYGRASRYGMVAFASSLDQAGVMAKTAQDCATVLSALCGPDILHDSTSLHHPKEDFSQDLEQPLTGIKIGLPKAFFHSHLEESLSKAIEEALKTYEKLGAQLVDIELPYCPLAVSTYYIIAAAECSSNLSRFDGIRYGHRSKTFESLVDLYRQSRTEGFGKEVKRRIMLGTYVLSHGYYDAYYRKAQQVRRLIAQDFQNAFNQCDLIAGPVCPNTAWPLGSHQQEPLDDYLADIFTLPASLAGLPGMSLPVGFDKTELPVGLQLIGNYLQESLILRVAHQLQKVTDWHKQWPPGI